MTARNTYRRPMTGWYHRHPRFMAYMLREGTSVLLGLYAMILLWGLTALAAGPAAWAHWLAALVSPQSVLMHLLILAAALYHTISWFQVAPKAAPPLRFGGRQVPDHLIIRGGYAACAAVSLFVLFIAW
jgi:fumarate reductase subunit C